VNNFSYSPAGQRMTEGFEGLRLTAYQDVAGIWTIGYGHTGPGICAGMVITDAGADALLLSDLAASVACVNHVVTVPLQQCQFDALVDFAFNAGRGALINSTLLRKLNSGDFASAAAQFGLWVHAGGQIVEGLVRRRKVEAQMFAGIGV
jgi:lysozyme